MNGGQRATLQTVPLLSPFHGCAWPVPLSADGPSTLRFETGSSINLELTYQLLADQQALKITSLGWGTALGAWAHVPTSGSPHEC